MEIKSYNRNWKNDSLPYITVITPIYNRRSTIKRTLDSVDNQTFRNFEYILVDDGSTAPADDIIEEFMQKTDIPVLYIKKENGGVHTARNLGVRYARGLLQTSIDSDDELVPEALEIFYKTWSMIPDDKKSEYREIVAQCMDQNGRRVGDVFPNNINSVDWEKAIVMCNQTKGEHVGCNVTKIMKDNPWPQPEGVTFVTENILWKKLEHMYKSYFINDMVRVYHTDTEESYSNSRKRNLQYCINWQWNYGYQLNHYQIYKGSPKDYFKKLMLYLTFSEIVKRKGGGGMYLERKIDIALSGVLKIPAIMVAMWFEKKKM